MGATSVIDSLTLGPSVTPVSSVGVGGYPGGSPFLETGVRFASPRLIDGRAGAVVKHVMYV